MNCSVIAPELTAYHFGAVSPESRQEIELHLLSCRECLKQFLDLKREIETAESEPSASPATRQRLRRAVKQELDQRLGRRTWAWWERPLAFGFAGAAVVIAMLAMHAVSTGPGAMPRTLTLEGWPAASEPARVP